MFDNGGGTTAGLGLVRNNDDYDDDGGCIGGDGGDSGDKCFTFVSTLIGHA